MKKVSGKTAAKKKSAKWICPNCRRTFGVKNVLHSCYPGGTVDKHFQGKPPELRKAYDKLEKAVLKFGEVNISPVKTAIYFKRAGAFAGIKVVKDHFKLEFFLPEKTDVFPIEKTVQYTKSKVVHFVSIGEPGDITPQLLKWLKQSYDLSRA